MWVLRSNEPQSERYFLSVNSIIDNDRYACVVGFNGLSGLILRKILLIEYLILTLRTSKKRGEVCGDIGSPSQVFLPRKPAVSAPAVSSLLSAVRLLLPLIRLQFPKQVISPRIIGFWEILPQMEDSFTIL